MGKQPAIQFYPGDWLRDQVSGCSMAAQGLWLRMLFIMHDCEEYGRLVVDGKPMPSDMVARKCGITPIEFQGLLTELMDAKIPSIDSHGILFNRRMVLDAKKRKKWRKYQRKHRDTARQSQRPVRPMSSVSSSSSSSSSSKKEKNIGADALFVLPAWIPRDAWDGYLEMRSKKRAPATLRAKQMAVRTLEDLRKKGCEPGAVLDQSVLRGWTGLFPINGKAADTKPEESYEEWRTRTHR